jgi:hypothetical protein
MLTILSFTLLIETIEFTQHELQKRLAKHKHTSISKFGKLAFMASHFNLMMKMPQQHTPYTSHQ